MGKDNGKLRYLRDRSNRSQIDQQLLKDYSSEPNQTETLSSKKSNDIIGIFIAILKQPLKRFLIICVNKQASVTLNFSNK